MGEGVTGGKCSRQLVLLPANENQREGLATWLAELARVASRRSSNMVAVVEERGEWRKRRMAEGVGKRRMVEGTCEKKEEGGKGMGRK